MTDLEKTKELYNSLDIGFLETRGYRPMPTEDNPNASKYVIELDFKAYEGNIKGYSDFVMEMVFDIDGKFIEMGIWE